MNDLVRGIIYILLAISFLYLAIFKVDNWKITAIKKTDEVNKQNKIKRRYKIIKVMYYICSMLLLITGIVVFIT
ncbi:hypothetical protein [Apilactobacillus timberlakei]|uniref:hypothetical protein n=1 Tax=Apilactobacillus timberlakei TaxID=2008380 RepID=UPI00112C28BE|nr:hypothetical protein [Apilactobacillus timberlakei]TPR16752.1 hypothetical protein DYZ95_07160 [Apilactobacillus timberlakei]TPR21515.1 hypothetical protein DY083_05710 [Apilactobacillus timberlakei]